MPFGPEKSSGSKDLKLSPCSSPLRAPKSNHLQTSSFSRAIHSQVRLGEILRPLPNKEKNPAAGVGVGNPMGSVASSLHFLLGSECFSGYCREAGPKHLEWVLIIRNHPILDTMLLRLNWLFLPCKISLASDKVLS